ncbi:unnamed protein product [Clonostachys solani]|uniref:Uncharacterized protein n=1 Tax=Clonostachys solani TaxID=160281 RepID=A0A9N9YZL6_9HYPO|nr:unnamed protein product [Clonostachys solani]
MVARVQRRWREEARAEDGPQPLQTRVINFATTNNPILEHLSRNPLQRLPSHDVQISSSTSRRITLARADRILRTRVRERLFHACSEEV